MPRPCTVCAHPSRHDADLALARGASLASVARDLGVSRNAVARHRDAHLAQQRLLVDLTAEADALTAGAVHAQAQALYLRSMEVLATLEAGEVVGVDDEGQPIVKRSTATVLKALREVRANVELLARLTVAGDGGRTERTERVDLDAAIARALDRVARRPALESGSVVDAEVISEG